MNILRNVILFSILVLFSYSSESKEELSKDVWETRFNKFLNDVQENSIRNKDWDKNDWDKFIGNQLK